MRFALAVEYSGHAFCGFQSQPSGCGVQDALERAIGEIAGHPVTVIAAGRTDAGVHAVSQIVHFDTDVDAPGLGLGPRRQHAPAACRGRLVGAPGVGRLSCALCRDRPPLHVPAAHARRAAGPACRDASAGTITRSTSRRCMRPRRTLLGTHDFSTFRAAECQAKSPVKTLTRAEATQQGPFIRFDFSANAFLHHMVRNIVGALVYVGAGRQEPAWIAELLGLRDRTRAAPTFAADGLYLAGATYDARFGLPPTVRRGHARGRMNTVRTRVKICGITRIADALAAAQAGADAIGLVFWPGTPRCVDVGRAREIAEALPPFVTKVALFVDPVAEHVRAVLACGSHRRAAIPW